MQARQERSERAAGSKPSRPWLTIIVAVSTAVHLAILAAASLFPPPPVEPARTVRIEVIRFQQQGDDSEDWGTIGRVHAIVSREKLSASTGQ
ncbi:MAG TPA: hypothetical protein PLI95_00650 [Polyangiaceae bacterium]|nr:hypothetical protein [Polyangiaceae bacterium]